MSQQQVCLFDYMLDEAGARPARRPRSFSSKLARMSDPRTPDLATIWRKAGGQLAGLQVKTTQLAELGHLLENGGSADRECDA